MHLYMHSHSKMKKEYHPFIYVFLQSGSFACAFSFRNEELNKNDQIESRAHLCTLMTFMHLIKK